MLNAIWTIVLGILGASSLIIAKKPNAKELIEKLQPIQGWLGAVSAVWGAWIVIQGVLNLGTLSKAPLVMVIYFTTSGCFLVLGFLLGLGILKSFTKDSAKLDELAIKLSPWQGTLGLICIGLGVWSLLGALGIM